MIQPTKRKLHIYRSSEIKKMKELLRTGFKVSEIAPAYHKDFGVSLASFRYKLYQLAKVTRKKRGGDFIIKPFSDPKNVTRISSSKEELHNEPIEVFSSIQHFINNERYVKSTDSEVSLLNLYREYLQYWENEKEKTGSLKFFASTLRNLGFEIVRHYSGRWVKIAKVPVVSTATKQEVLQSIEKKLPKNIEFFENRMVIHF